MIAVGESSNFLEKVEYTDVSGIKVCQLFKTLLKGLNSTKLGSIKEYKILKNKAPFFN